MRVAFNAEARQQSNAQDRRLAEVMTLVNADGDDPTHDYSIH
jgi:hypothetical protein